MKKILAFTLVCLLLLAAAPAFAAKCSHHYEYETQYAMRPTCTESAGYVLKCIYCGHREKVVTEEALGHDWVVDKVLTERNATTHGIVREKCSRQFCTETRIVTDPHTFGKWEVRDAGNGNQPIIEARVCKVCGKEQTRETVPEGTLKQSNSFSAEAKELQQMLKDLGYLKDKADGFYGKNTAAAVTAFQNARGFTADGIAWPQTVEAVTHDWQVLKGIISDYPEVCCRSEDGEAIWLCEMHSYLQDAAQKAAAAGEKLQKEALDMCAAEVGRMYDALAATCADTELTQLLTARVGYVAELARCADDPDALLSLYCAQCVDLCERADAVAAG